MSNLWWLEPGWTDACCMSCGANIYATGGDPDWGYCYGCFTAHMREQEIQAQEQEIERLQIENEELRRNQKGSNQ